jgi:hypothetical protein
VGLHLWGRKCYVNSTVRVRSHRTIPPPPTYTHPAPTRGALILGLLIYDVQMYGCPFQTSHISSHHCRKTAHATRMKSAAYEKGTPRVSLRYLKVAAPAAVLWYAETKSVTTTQRNYGECTEVMRLIWQPSRPGLTRFWSRRVCSTVLRYASEPVRRESRRNSHCVLQKPQ